MFVDYYLLFYRLYVGGFLCVVGGMLMYKSTRDVAIAMSVVFLLFSVYFLLCVLVDFRRQWWLFRRGVKVDAKIELIEKWPMPYMFGWAKACCELKAYAGYKTYHCVFVDKQDVKFITKFDRTAFKKMERFKEGDEVKIVYDRRDPTVNKWLD